MLLGGLYMNGKKYEDAAGQYKKVLEQDPKNDRARFYLGTNLAEMKKFGEAEASFRELLRIEPDNFMGNFYLARILVEMKRYDEAEIEFRKILSQRPDAASILIDLALLYEQQEKIPQAIETYKKLIDISPQNIQTLIRLGHIYLRQQLLDEAQNTFLAVLKLDPSNREALIALGLLSLEQGNHEQAITKFLSLLQKSPKDIRLIYMLGAAYEEAGNYDKAIETLKQIPYSSDQFADTQIRIGFMLKKQQKTDEAIVFLQDAISRKKDAPNLYTFLASLHEDKRQFAAAESVIREGLLANPDNIDLNFSLGVLYEKTNRFEESVTAMQKVLKIEHDNPEALNFIGYMYADRGLNLDEAERLIRKALRLKPGNGYMLDSLGWVLFRKDRLAEAIIHLKQASELLPEDATILEHLGDAYLQSGDAEKASETFDRCLKINPDSEKLKKKAADVLKK
jgi:tetratricopeptide (TPR) repeat protein